MAKIKIPADVSELKKRAAASLAKRLAGPIKDPAAKARAEKEAAERVKRKELAKELESEKLTASEREAKIKELQDSLDAVTRERDDLKPNADQWKKHEHVERTKILEKIPVEQRKDAKDLPLGALRTFAKAFTSDAGGAGGTGDKGKKPEPLSYEEAEAKGPEAINKWFEDQKTATK
jgi:hypothetical protein